MPALINYDDVVWLKTNSIDIFMANALKQIKYITSINRSILANIDKCRSLTDGSNGTIEHVSYAGLL